MNPAEFAREIERANRRMVELRRATAGETGSAWVDTALTELSCAFEELKVAEEELTSQNLALLEAHAGAEFERHRYRELFMSSPFGLLVTDLRGTITEANRAAGELLAAPAPLLAGKPLALMVALADRPRFSRWLAILKEAAHEATVCSECGGSGEYQMDVGPHGPAFRCEMSAAPMADRFGRIDSIRWCLRDVSDRERVRGADWLLDEVRRKDELLAVIGHELRNPVAAIMLAAEALAGEDSDPVRQRWGAEVIRRQAEQLRRLVDDLLDVSRVSHGKVHLHREAVDLREVVGAAVEACQALLESKHHTVAIAVPDAPVVVSGDRQRLHQVLANLVDNAAKYTPAGGRIEVELARDGGRAFLRVRDTGIGIAEPALQRIFDTFEQGDRAGALPEGGLGLGLALVRQLVALHGGTVRAASDGEGKGATFEVELAAAKSGRPESHERSSAPPPEPPAVADGTRVLLVDDNTDAAELLADRLRRFGWSVDLAFDGSGGLALARQDDYRVALVDLGLPDVDGFELARTLKQERPALHLVAVTGYSDARSRERAEAAGFGRFLVKPLDAREVAAAIAELVASLAS
jgi:signal transduction histidine kinase/CheY-like chemotaxis protein